MTRILQLQRSICTTPEQWTGVYIAARAVSADGLMCCTISNDRSVKIYDVVNYDMMVMIGLSFVLWPFFTLFTIPL
jgi:hypothetical protein